MREEHKGQHNERRFLNHRYGGFRVLSFTFDFLGRRFGWTSDVVGRAECPYLRRHILWFGLGTLRLHKFMRSDNDEALHDHPWWFWTFPLRTYWELVPHIGPPVCHCGEYIHRHGAYSGHQPVELEGRKDLLEVRGWRPHFRPAEYTHAVQIDRSIWTVVLTGTKRRTWGFWRNNHHVPWRDWFRDNPLPPCAEPEEVQNEQ